uniref:Uncharacterized protein n=1 Tax=Thermogemmatispora argillosa TaxID=2045280 RepID=A0A455T3L9_9CHLR|nr:hypothetical protein KTA_21980 [Thermogemmatispora argillosa]
MTGSPETSAHQGRQPGEERAGVGESTAADTVESGGQKQTAAAARAEIAGEEHETGAEATLERQAVAVDRQEQAALIVSSPDTIVAEHDADTLPLAHPVQQGASQQATFHSAPTVPVLSQESTPVAQQPQRWSRGRLRPEPQKQVSRGASGGPNFKKLWLGTLIASVLLLLLSVSLLIYLLTVLAAREGLSPSSLLSATASGKLAGGQRGQTAATIELAIFPQSLSPANCLPDNGYRCTVTLMASGPAGSVHWQAWAQGVAARVNPASGSIEPGQQQQLIIYLPATCPASGKIIFSWNDQQLSLPWRC